MIRIDYDILFSIRASLIAKNNEASRKIQAASWRFTPTQATAVLMKKHHMLFKEVDGVGLLLAEPTKYAVVPEWEKDKEVAIFNLPESLRFTLSVSLSRPALSEYVNLEPGKTDDGFPKEKKEFFDLAFPGRKPAYVLHEDRLKDTQAPVNVEDAVAPPVNRLSFDKSNYSDLTLKGPLPKDKDTEIPTSKIIVFEDGEEKRIENPVAIEYPVDQLPEGIYQLDGKKNDKAFSGKIFLHSRIVKTPPIAYLQIEIPAGDTKAGERVYVVRFKEGKSHKDRKKERFEAKANN